jgi:hypothetical protein
MKNLLEAMLGQTANFDQVLFDIMHLLPKMTDSRINLIREIYAKAVTPEESKGDIESFNRLLELTLDYMKAARVIYMIPLKASEVVGTVEDEPGHFVYTMKDGSTKCSCGHRLET